MRFLTWNIQAGGGDRVSLILDEIERLSPDVVALSEVTYNNLEELRRRLCEQGLNHIETTSRAGGPNSVMIGRFGKLANAPARGFICGPGEVVKNRQLKFKWKSKQSRCL